jgi:hypothetical protein
VVWSNPSCYIFITGIYLQHGLKMRAKGFWWKLLIVFIVTALGVGVSGHGGRNISREAEIKREPIKIDEFSRIVQEFSEPGGYFRSDNFTSNETSYLHVVDILRELRVSGGAYIGVGPEQNFTYISKIRPQIAFIVDIRRQAIIQHLMYKAIFHRAENRAQFLSTLFCRPLSGPKAPGAGAAAGDLVDYFQRTPASKVLYVQNLSRLQRTIGKEFLIPLSESDTKSLDYVYGMFRDFGIDISYNWPYSVRSPGGMGGYGMHFPTFGDLILQGDQKERLGNFLASEDDYGFVRKLHQQNRIIPVNGDFAGTKALKAIGGYLAQNKYTLSAFYTSNVEQFLFQNEVYDRFVANVRALPVDGRSVFIRAVARMRQPHPAWQPGHRTTTLLQKLTDFLRDEDANPYQTYWELVTTHYIAGAPAPEK